MLTPFEFLPPLKIKEFLKSKGWEERREQGHLDKWVFNWPDWDGLMVYIPKDGFKNKGDFIINLDIIASKTGLSMKEVWHSINNFEKEKPLNDILNETLDIMSKIVDNQSTIMNELESKTNWSRGMSNVYSPDRLEIDIDKIREKIQKLTETS